MTIAKTLHLVGSNNNLEYQCPDNTIYQGSWKIAFSTALFRALKVGPGLPVTISINWVQSLERTSLNSQRTEESALCQFLVVRSKDGQTTLQQNLNLIYFTITHPFVKLKVLSLIHI